jgi:membrane protein
MNFLWQRFLEDHCLQAAGALAFTSLFALVPLIAAILGILAAFPVFSEWRDTITHFMFENFVPAAGDVVQNYFTEFAANASKATAIGILVLLFSAVSLMISIEDTFNRIWRVPKGRPQLSRFIMYWAVITLGPLLFVALIAISSYVLALPFLDSAETELSLKARMLALAPFVIQWVALAIAYSLIPNRTVRVRDALAGALIAALLFEGAKHGFTSYVTRGANYQQVYGALAIVPIFIFWIYLSWIIVLLGASFTASVAAFDYRSPNMPHLEPGDEFRGLLRVLSHFAGAQRQGMTLRSADLCALEPFLTDDLRQRYLTDLDRAALIQRAEGGGWVLARDLSSMTLYDLYRRSGYRLPSGEAPPDTELALDAPAARVLEAAQTQLHDKLDVPLSEIFPAPARSDNELPTEI